MPIYEYVCRHCGKELERLRKLADAPLTECPECGEAALKRKVSAAGFRLSGKGWYETDFKADGRRNIAGDQSTPGKDQATGSGETAGQPAKSDKTAAQTKTAGAEGA